MPARAIGVTAHSDSITQYRDVILGAARACTVSTRRWTDRSGKLCTNILALNFNVFTTLFLGGDTSEAKMPFLGNIPFFGANNICPSPAAPTKLTIVSGSAFVRVETNLLSL